MFEQIEMQILGTLQALFDQFGWAGVFAMMTFENATGITPSEIVLTLAGWMLISAHGSHPVLILFGGLIASLGSTLGSSLIYWAARIGGRPLIYRFAHLVRIEPELIDQAESQFHRWGSGLVLIGRMIPGVRTLVSIPAGLARMPYHIFLASTLIGTYIWCTLLIGAGWWLGHEWMTISVYVKQALPFILAGGVTAIAIYLLIQARSQRTLAKVYVDNK